MTARCKHGADICVVCDLGECRAAECERPRYCGVGDYCIGHLFGLGGKEAKPPIKETPQ